MLCFQQWCSCVEAPFKTAYLPHIRCQRLTFQYCIKRGREIGEEDWRRAVSRSSGSPPIVNKIPASLLLSSQ